MFIILIISVSMEDFIDVIEISHAHNLYINKNQNKQKNCFWNDS
jgi:hypothetical protein